MSHQCIELHPSKKAIRTELAAIERTLKREQEKREKLQKNEEGQKQFISSAEEM